MAAKALSSVGTTRLSMYFFEVIAFTSASVNLGWGLALFPVRGTTTGVPGPPSESEVQVQVVIVCAELAYMMNTTRK